MCRILCGVSPFAFSIGLFAFNIPTSADDSIFVLMRPFIVGLAAALGVGLAVSCAMIYSTQTEWRGVGYALRSGCLLSLAFFVFLPLLVSL
jgi:hypothetical protein